MRERQAFQLAEKMLLFLFFTITIAYIIIMHINNFVNRNIITLPVVIGDKKMKTSLLKTILSTSCLSFIVCSTSAMAELKDETLAPHFPRTHTREQARTQMNASEALAIEAYKLTSISHYSAAREAAEKLAKDFGKVAGAQKVLDIQKGIFWTQRNKIDYRIAFKPTTSALD